MTWTEPADNPPAQEPAARGRLRRFLNRLEVDRATFYAVTLRVWQLAGGLVSFLLITTFFSQEVQGYYFVFASLMAMQVFFELNFSIVIKNVCSHEWVKLQLDEQGRIFGDEVAFSRLVSLGRLLFRWYAVACLLFVACVGIGGAVYLMREAPPAVGVDWEVVDWEGPWLALVILTGLLLWTLPFNAFLEGCNQVATVNRYRLIQAVCANAAVWLSLLLSLDLWVAVSAAAARLLVDLVLLGVRYRQFFRPFLTASTPHRIGWRTELLPLQWRIAVQGITGYFAFSLFVLVMKSYHGPAVAGRMGMTWTLVATLQYAALAWVLTRVPLFGKLIAKRDFVELDRVFRRLTAISLGILGAGGAVLWGFVYALNILQLRLGGDLLANRLLAPWPTAIFIAAAFIYQIPHCQDMYLRAHKRDPVYVFRTLENVAIGLLVWWLGSRYGPLGASLGYLAVVAIFVFPCLTIVWIRCRAKWH